MSGYLPASQAARVLGVSDKTVVQWIKRGRFPGARVVMTPQNQRQWAIPTEEIQRVAAETGRPLGSSELPNPPELPDVWAAIGDLRATVEQLGREVETLRTSVSSEPSRTSPPPEAPMSGTSPEVPNPLFRALTQRRALRGKTQPKEGRALPPHLVSLSAFTHHIPETTRLRYIKEHLPHSAHTGDWREEDRKSVRYALDAEQQHAYYLYFKDHRYFEPCAGCPHGLTT